MMAKYPEQGLAMAFTVVMMAGAFQFILGSLKLGKYVTLMPYSVISGFMSGIGIILIILQFAPLLGHQSPTGGVIGTLTNLPSLIADLHFAELILGLATLAVIFYFPKKYRKYVPAQLVALVLITLISVIIFDTDSIRRIGPIPTGLPNLVFPTFTAEQMVSMVIEAMVLGTLGCIDTLLTAVIADSLTRQEHDSNKELKGQGIANMISGLFGALPGAGATMGTVVSIQAGARSPAAAIIRAIILMLVVLVAGSLIEPIPMAVLAGIALFVGISILDWSFLQRAHKASMQQTAIMYSVMFLTVFVDLLVAVGLGVFISNIIVIERLSREQAKHVKAISDADHDDVPLNRDERTILDKAKGQILFFYLSGPMIFSVSKAISRQHSSVHKYKAMILDLSDVPMIDMTVGLALENAIKDAIEAHCEVFIYCPNDDAKHQLERLGIDELIGKERFVNTRLQALNNSLEVVEAVPFTGS
jgi:SulP family sulfate permease